MTLNPWPSGHRFCAELVWMHSHALNLHTSKMHLDQTSIPLEHHVQEDVYIVLFA